MKRNFTENKLQIKRKLLIFIDKKFHRSRDYHLMSVNTYHLVGIGED
jgi:hypothetical protein